ncbi:MAG TPA: pyruvate dehydrogenase complex E1 component subunit beta [Chitinophagaceae bacterium]|jgi:pyruvate dehydrogenase E1 component beta subunit|nr:pyruvate dehydrogenase complex E1 component subunit beta [Chitinophagaceae bacterium]HMW67737.1 pyruvate dehydrogenase complex E1 component subunit beta [Chitinophagaceae bacterium]HNA92083.1 pyruvate dehydrogenase complex E1 component subunit beta [Chitinophagaceae bacterium]HNC39274.1 pyruvate dehydrogenase complex E1 component subunit beta [Chitinophagaceae bacterium]HND94256.1 pyruvate dehydrogenase complex E1 component subunit beta [Chitinophagaceae bacterium]
MSRIIAFREALREAMSEEMRRDDRVYLMGEEVAEYNGAYKVSQGMLAEFGPRRVIDTPISELGFAAVGVGSAQNGLRPIVEFMTWNFAVLALDQILNTASKMLAMSGGQISCPIVFRGGNASAGQLGAQHSTAFESLYANIPGIKVVSPSNGYDAKGLLKQAIRFEEDPVMFMESEQMYGDKIEVPAEEYYIELGKADIKRAGRDVTIVSFNKMMKVALAAADELEKEGISAEVIDLRTIRPLDWMTVLESVKKTNRLVIVEEQWPFGSVSSELSYRIQKEGFDYLDAPIRRITAADAPLHYAANLVAAALPDVPRTVKLVKEVLYLVK